MTIAPLISFHYTARNAILSIRVTSGWQRQR